MTTASPYSKHIYGIKDLASARKEMTDRLVSLAGFKDRSEVRIPWGALVLQRLYVTDAGSNWISITNEAYEQKIRVKAAPDAVFRISIDSGIQRALASNKNVIWEAS